LRVKSRVAKGGRRNKKGIFMIQSQDRLNAGIDALAGIEPGFARALGNAGYPEPRIREPGYTTLLRTIVGQQVSVAAATSNWKDRKSDVEGRSVEVRGEYG